MKTRLAALACAALIPLAFAGAATAQPGDTTTGWTAPSVVKTDASADSSEPGSDIAKFDVAIHPLTGALAARTGAAPYLKVRTFLNNRDAWYTSRYQRLQTRVTGVSDTKVPFTTNFISVYVYNADGSLNAAKSSSTVTRTVNGKTSASTCKPPIYDGAGLAYGTTPSSVLYSAFPVACLGNPPYSVSTRLSAADGAAGDYAGPSPAFGYSLSQIRSEAATFPTRIETTAGVTPKKTYYTGTAAINARWESADNTVKVTQLFRGNPPQLDSTFRGSFQWYFNSPTFKPVAAVSADASQWSVNLSMNQDKAWVVTAQKYQTVGQVGVMQPWTECQGMITATYDKNTGVAAVSVPRECFTNTPSLRVAVNNYRLTSGAATSGVSPFSSPLRLS